MDNLPLIASAAGAAVVLAVAFAVAWLTARGNRRDLARKAEHIERQLEQLREDLHGIAAAQRPIDERIARLAAWVERERVLGATQLGAAPRAYELAARMAANGAARDDLVASCGLTLAEADLAMRIHHSRDRSRAAFA